MNIQPRLLTLAAVSVLGLSACATTGYPNNGYAGSPPPASSNGVCYDCGTVTRIDATGSVTGTQRSGVTGAVIGGLVGAAAGRTIANDSSTGRRNVATVGGAAAGAAAGAAIERNMGAGSGAVYNVYVRMDDGRQTVVSQSDLGGVREGTRVRVYNGRVWAR